MIYTVKYFCDIIDVKQTFISGAGALGDVSKNSDTSVLLLTGN